MKENSLAADTGSRSLCGSIERPKPRMSKAKLKMKILALERTLQETREEKERCKELLEQREAGGSSPGATDVAEQLEEKARLEEQVGALERDLVSLKESDEKQIGVTRTGNRATDGAAGEGTAAVSVCRGRKAEVGD